MGPNKKHVHIVHIGKPKEGKELEIKLPAKKIVENHFTHKCPTCKGTGTVESIRNRKIYLDLCPDCDTKPNKRKNNG